MPSGCKLAKDRDLPLDFVVKQAAGLHAGGGWLAGCHAQLPYPNRELLRDRHALADLQSDQMQMDEPSRTKFIPTRQRRRDVKA